MIKVPLYILTQDFEPSKGCIIRAGIVIRGPLEDHGDYYSQGPNGCLSRIPKEILEEYIPEVAYKKSKKK